MTDWLQIMIDVADGILLGIPSTVLLSDIQHNYDVEIADLTRTYNLLQKELSNNYDLKQDIENKQYKLLSNLSNTSPLGAWRQQLNNEYKYLEEKKKYHQTKIDDILNKTEKVSNELTQKQIDAGASTLGSEASRRLHV